MHFEVYVVLHGPVLLLDNPCRCDASARIHHGMGGFSKEVSSQMPKLISVLGTSTGPIRCAPDSCCQNLKGHLAETLQRKLPDLLGPEDGA